MYVTLSAAVAFLASMTSARQYEAFPGPFTWEQARDKCGTKGMAIIITQDDLEGVIAARKSAGLISNNLWIGLNDKEINGAWRQSRCAGDALCDKERGVDCNNLDFWAPNEPNDYFGDASENCAHLYKNGETINDLPCDWTNWGGAIGVLCNKKESNCPPAESPGQGYLALAPENDGDGFTWFEARRACRSKGTSLATILNLQDAQKALDERANTQKVNNPNARPSNLNAKGTNALFWVGLNDLDSLGNSEGKWNYLDGDCNGDCKDLPMWNAGEPNDYKPLGGEDCAHIWNGDRTTTNMLNDLPCKYTKWGSNPMYALCNAKKSNAAQAVYSEPEPEYFGGEEFEAPPREFPTYSAPSNDVYTFTSSDLMVFGLVLANIVTVAVSAYLCCSGRKQSASYSKVDQMYTSDEECNQLNQ